MKGIKILENGIELPGIKTKNTEIEDFLNLEHGYIKKRTGIENRYYAKNEKIEDIAYKSVEDLINKYEKKGNDITKLKKELGLIIVATTSTNILMPGIANYIQKKLEIKNCISLDILAGCSGYINAFDIAKLYIQTEKVEKALVVGVDILSKNIDKKDIGTAIVLSDGAGATLVGKSIQNKVYITNIKAEPDENMILTNEVNENIYMNGKEVYKYAVTKTVENINELLQKANININEIKYIIPHQSNLKIMKAIANRLNIDLEKMYINIQERGNTFCASIPIALNDMEEQKLLNSGDKIILLGYGGGLNTGSILLEF